jgi:hypothetical protein
MGLMRSFATTHHPHASPPEARTPAVPNQRCSFDHMGGRKRGRTVPAAQHKLRTRSRRGFVTRTVVVFGYIFLFPTVWEPPTVACELAPLKGDPDAVCEVWMVVLLLSIMEGRVEGAKRYGHHTGD